MGGLHRFSTWHRPMLTDSGGFQVFSLEGLRQDRRERRRVRQSHRRQRADHHARSRRWRSSGPSAPTSRWRSITSCPGRRRASWRRRGWSGPCGGWSGARGGIASWRKVGESRVGIAGCPSTLRHSDLPTSRPDALAHHPGRDLRRPPAPFTRGHAGAGPLDRHRHRGALGGRAQAGDAPRARGAGPRPAPQCPPLSYGRRVSPTIWWRGSPAGSICSTVSPRPGTGVMAAPGPRPARSTSAAPRSGCPSAPLDPDCDCETCLTVLARLPAPSVHGRGDAGAPAGVDSQHAVSRPPGRAGPRHDPGRHLRHLAPGLAPRYHDKARPA